MVAALAIYASFAWILLLSVGVSNAFSTPRVVSPNDFLAQLDRLDSLNDPTPERTALLTALCDTNPNPATASFATLGPGQWNVVYAPHMSAMGRFLLDSSFAPVQYLLSSADDGTSSITSHAHLQFFSSRQTSIWFSVAGTFGSVRENNDTSMSRVDFTRVWTSAWNAPAPIASLDTVPEGWWKQLVNAVGQRVFIEALAVFPVSYLDATLVVFDFELLGTRICAKKQV